MSLSGARRAGTAVLLLALLAAAGCDTEETGAPEAAPGAAPATAVEPAEGDPAAESGAPATGVLGRPASELLVEVEAGTGRLAVVPKPAAPAPAPPFAVDDGVGGPDPAAEPARPARDPEAEREFAAARRELGLALERVGDISGAVSELEAAAAAAPWPRRAGEGTGLEGTPWQDLARLCRRGEPAEAVARACSSAIASNRFAPAVLAELLALRGDAVAALGRPKRALSDYEAALEVESTQHRALLGRARLKIASGAPARALNDLRLAIGTGPRPAEAHLLRARAYEVLGSPDRAVADYDAVLADAGAAPWHPAAWRGRAAAHCAMGRAEAAAVDWQVWADSVPGGPAYLQEMLRARGYLRAPWEPGVGEATLAGLNGWAAAGCP